MQIHYLEIVTKQVDAVCAASRGGRAETRNGVFVSPRGTRPSKAGLTRPPIRVSFSEG